MHIPQILVQLLPLKLRGIVLDHPKVGEKISQKGEKDKAGVFGGPLFPQGAEKSPPPGAFSTLFGIARAPPKFFPPPR